MIAILPRRTIGRVIVGVSSVLALGLMTVSMNTSAAFGSEDSPEDSLDPAQPVQDVTQTTPDVGRAAGSEALTTQPARASTSDLLDPQPNAIDRIDEPTVIFVIDDEISSPREQIQQNRPENSNTLHFPLQN